MSIEEKTSSELIEDLINCWDLWDIYEDTYLTILAPNLVANPEKGNKTERAILYRLRELLDEKDWQDLPRLIAEKRAELLRNEEKERIRLEDLKKEARETKRIAKEVEGRKIEILQEIRNRLHSDFLGADAFFQESCGGLITEKEFNIEKILYVKSWLSTNTPLGRKGSEQKLDDEQVEAIASVHGDIQVVARAGSGKTLTLVNRAFFLLKHCNVAPSEILILAFNKKAVLEVRRRLLSLMEAQADQAISDEVERRIRGVGGHRQVKMFDLEAKAVDLIAKRFNVTLPYVMTFHALAYGIVHPEEGLLYNGVEGESQDLSRFVQRLIDDHRQVPEFQNKIRKLMLSHFRDDWDRIVEGRHNQSKEEFLRFRRSLQRECIGGEYVKSYGEKIIANFLFEHDIPYIYERNFWWGDVNYRPDFTIFKTRNSGVIIEYFGLKGEADYDEMAKEKRDYWEKTNNWSLIEFSPIDITSNGDEAFLRLLKDRIEEHGIICVRLSEEEIWQRIRDRAIDRFTVALVNFIGRCRKKHYPRLPLNYWIRRAPWVSLL